MVTAVLKAPHWFFGVDSGFVLFTFLVLFGVSLVSYRIYKFTNDRKQWYFLLAFISLTLGFFIRAITDLILFFRFDIGADVLNSSLIFVSGYILHIVFVLFGYLFLLIKALDLHDRKDVMALLFFLLIPVFLSSSYFTSFYLTSLILLTFTTYHFWKNCKSKKKCAPWFVFGAFCLITLAQLLYLLELVNPMFYVIGYGAQQIGYIFLLLALLKVLR